MHPEPAELPADPAGWARLFSEAGFSDPESAAAAWSGAARRLPAGGAFLARLGETWRLVRAAADPELAFRTWLRWIEGALTVPAGASPAAPGRELERRAAAWDAHAEFREGFIGIAGVSPALGEILLTSWEDFRPWDWRSGWETSSSLTRRLATATAPAADRDFPDAIRQFHRLERLRIAYLDCVAGMPVEQVTFQISAAADALIAACHARARDQVSRRLGRVAPEGGFVVLALGKLGGSELNYSSDVDLNFVHDDAAGPVAAMEGKKGADPRDAGTFFTLVAERMVQLITSFTDKGQLLRLDTRLRPQGSSGRLVWSFRATVEYYYATGRAWEKQALIRLRPVAGDLELGEKLRRELDAFVFPPTLSAADIAEIRGLKLQMEKLADDRGPSEAQIKSGRGGIRDVEYIVQFLQLVHAARIPALKAANMFQAFEVLDAHGLLSPEETDVLRQGYRFLRKVEHRIQMAHLRQTHRLPEDPRELLRLARGLGFDDTAAFLDRLAFHSRRIRKVYRLLFEEATRAEANEISALLALPADLAAKAGAEILASFGFEDPERAFLRLRSLSERSGDRHALDAARAKAGFARLAEKLLREVSRHPEPDRTLANFEECVQALGARSVFYALLEESPRVLQLFVEICARSSLVVETLRAHPDLFDELVDRLLTGSSIDRESLVAEVDRLRAARRAGGAPSPASDPDVDLFKLKHLNLLLIAVRDLERLDNLSTTLAHIADLSEALLHGVLIRSLEEAEAKMGAWAGEPPRFLVLGLGKLGGQEMSYKSDLDLVFLYSGSGRTEKGVGTQEYFERLSQAVLQACAAADSIGPLLRIDLRLRPLGNHNSLAITLEAWQQYFRGGGARTWERQAFLRARPVEGDAEIARQAMEFIHGAMVLGGAAGPPSREAIRRDVWEMRRKLEAHAKEGDLKRGEGGIMDIEFLVQALQLAHGREHPGIMRANTAAALREILAAGRLDATEGSELLTAYQFLRWIENRISLVGEAGQSLGSLASDQLESLAQKIGYKSSGEESAASIFQAELAYHKKRARRLLKQALEVE